MTKQRRLTAQEANRLAIQLQVVRINILDFALKYSFGGKSHLWGQVVDRNTLEREKAKLTELYRVKLIHETNVKNLPYLPSNGSKVEKIKEHYLAQDGTVGFVEVKDSSHGPSVVNHLMSKRTIKRMIRKKISSSNKKAKQMNKKRRAVKPPDDQDLLGFDSDVSNLLEGIDENLPVYSAGDKIEFVHAGGKIKGSVIKSGLQDGKVRAANASGTVFLVSPDDIIKDGSTAADHIAKRKGKKPIYESHQPEKPSKAQKQQAMVTPAMETARKAEKTLPKKGAKTQKELVEELAEKGEFDYNVIAEKTGVTRTNVGQYMYRWKKANPTWETFKTKKK